MGREVRALGGIVLVVAGVVLAVPAAEASFPGANGKIAFARKNSSGRSTIWTVEPRTGQTRQLTHVSRRCASRGGQWDDRQPSSSTSGRMMVYRHRDSCDPRLAHGIYTMGSDGSQRHLVLRDDYRGSVRLYLDYPALSPTGNGLAFSEWPDAGSYWYPVVTTLRAPTRSHKLAFPARYQEIDQPAWSVNGRLAVWAGSGTDDLLYSGHIVALSAHGGHRRLVTRSVRDLAPDWSPAGGSIVFLRERPGGSSPELGDVFVAAARGSGRPAPRRLTFIGNASFPVWSPDGRYIAFVRARASDSPNGSLWVMRADGRGQRLIATHVLADRISWQPLPRR